MTSRGLAGILGIAVFSTSIAAQQPSTQDRFIGNWVGALKTPAINLRMALTVKHDSAGGLAGEMISLDQGSAKIPATITAHGDTLVVAMPTAGASYTATLSARGDSLEGSFKQGGALPLAMGKVAALPVAQRPQEPKPPFPYDTQSVAFESVQGVKLSGTLTTPRGAGPFPAVVLVTGSGPQNRDEELLGHKPFLVIADYLARHGIAALRYDDRGTAKSTGNFATATSVDFANDAAAAVHFLQSAPRIAKNRIGIVGHSEGGLIAPMVAARSKDVAFIVLLSGPGIPGDSILLLQQALIAKATGAPQTAIDRAATVNRQLYAAVKNAKDSADAVAKINEVVAKVLADATPAERQLGEQQLNSARSQLLSPWMRYFLTYDPRPTLQKVHVPVLALGGMRDLQVPANVDLPAIKAAVEAGGNKNVRIVELPGLNHLFQTATTGSPTEYGSIEETFSPAALEIIANWITSLK